MLHEKLLRTSIAAVFEGRLHDVKIKCNNKQKRVLEYATIATKNLQKILEKTDPDIEEVTEALSEYKRACNQFSVMFNISWPM